MNQTSPRVIFTVIICISVISLSFGSMGSWLLWKGYQGGELLIGTAGTLAGSLSALLSSTRTQPPETHTTTTVTTGPGSPPSQPPTEPAPVVVVNPPSQPANVTEVSKTN